MWRCNVNGINEINDREKGTESKSLLNVKAAVESDTNGTVFTSARWELMAWTRRNLVNIFYPRHRLTPWKQPVSTENGQRGKIVRLSFRELDARFVRTARTRGLTRRRVVSNYSDVCRAREFECCHSKQRGDRVPLWREIVRRNETYWSRIEMLSTLWMLCLNR